MSQVGRTSSSKRSRKRHLSQTVIDSDDEGQPIDDEIPLKRKKLDSIQQNGSIVSNTLQNGPTNANGIPSFREGAIKKVTMKNFMTYDDCMFEPGPGLNLVLGPNGTGKSSIVSAICVGLSGNPKLLGRATKVKDYIKHGKDDAFIEIELHRENKKNLVITRTFKTNQQSTWKLNGKVVTKDKIEKTIAGLNIQLDNLTQFLPQDRVCEFASLGPVDLLNKTEEAVLPPEIVECHEKLIKLRKTQKEKQNVVENFKQVLEQLKKKNEMLEKDVKRFKQRQEHLLNVEQLKMKKPFVVFSSKQYEAKRVKEQLNIAKANLKEFEEKLRPLQEKLDQFKQEQKELQNKHNENVKKIRNTVKIQAITDKLSELQAEYDQLIDNLKKLHQREKEREQKKQKLKKYIEDMKRKMDSGPKMEEVNAELNQKTQNLREVDKQYQESMSRRMDVQSKIQDLRQEISSYQKQIQKLDDIKQQRLRYLRDTRNNHVVEAWNWVETNKHRFQDKVHLVALDVQVPNPLHAKYLETQCQGYLLTSFIVTNDSDRNVLQTEVVEKRGLKTGVNIIKRDNDKFETKYPCELEKLKKYGITHYLDQVFRAPSVVKAVLIENLQLHKIAVGTNQTQTMIEDALKEVSMIYTPDSVYAMRHSRYDKNITSTSVTQLKEAKIFRGGDTKQKETLVRKLDELRQKMAHLEKSREQMEKEESRICSKREVLRNQKKKLEMIRKDIIRSQNRIKQLEQELASLSREEDIEALEADIYKKIRRVNKERAKRAIMLTDQMKTYQKLMLAEDTYPLLQARYITKIRQLEMEHRETKEQHALLQKEVQALDRSFTVIKQDLRRLKAEAETARQRYMEKHKITYDEAQHILIKLPEDLQTIETRIVEEETAAASIYHDPRVIQQYEERKREIEKKEEEFQFHEDELNAMNEELEQIKQKWEPALKKCVEQINETFMQYCSNIGISGEVQLVPHEDYDKWEIQIKVKFRDSEQLATLSAMRQSGGERSVTTILYLLALQKLNKAPFRVVDEINQGMDPENERKIFYQMLESSKGPDIPQSFLITPKLLPNLVPEDASNITILLIYNGAWNLKQDEITKVWFKN